MEKITIKTIPAHIAYTAEYDINDYNDFFNAETGENILQQLDDLMRAENPGVTIPDEPDDYNYIEHPAGTIPMPPMHISYFDMTDRRGQDNSTGKYHFVEKSEIQAACMKHQGPYETIGCGYEKVLSWIEDNGYTVAGAGRSSFICEPWDCGGDREKYVIEIQIPILRQHGKNL